MDNIVYSCVFIPTSYQPRWLPLLMKQLKTIKFNVLSLKSASFSLSKNTANNL
ncbi:hypothetical protein PPRY_a3701 [Pseudoalteromonas prydzensis ACAM 620]|nr:hypothetical protein [Pseudoalteromonas prydzensis ACAM 620]